jgi:hypothetical protein
VSRIVERIASRRKKIFLLYNFIYFNYANPVTRS